MDGVGNGMEQRQVECHESFSDLKLTVLKARGERLLILTPATYLL